MLHCSGTASSVPFQQLGCCGKPAGESHQPQECGELLETVGWGVDVDPCPGNGGQLPSALGSCQCTGLPTPGLGVRCLLTPQDRQKVGWQQTKHCHPMDWDASHHPPCPRQDAWTRSLLLPECALSLQARWGSKSCGSIFLTASSGQNIIFLFQSCKRATGLIFWLTHKSFTTLVQDKRLQRGILWMQNPEMALWHWNLNLDITQPLLPLPNPSPKPIALQPAFQVPGHQSTGHKMLLSCKIEDVAEMSAKAYI